MVYTSKILNMVCDVRSVRVVYNLYNERIVYDVYIVYNVYIAHCVYIAYNVHIVFHQCLTNNVYTVDTVTI